MNSENLKELLYFYNPWWVKGKVPPVLVAGYQRPVLKKLFSYLSLERILIIKGARRTGKTTLLYQIIDALLNQGIPSQNIFFFSFDGLRSEENFGEIIKTYQELSKNILPTTETIYFFLDEIQFLPDWSSELKRYFDRKYPLKFIVSGSAASLIKKGAESLSGRTVEEVITPFTFYEYLNYRLRNPEIQRIIDSYRQQSVFSRMPSKNELVPYETQIKIIWGEYLKKGGFPHLFGIEEEIIWKKLLQEDVIEKVIYRDLIELFGVEKPRTLEKLFLYLANHSSEILNISNIANSLKLSRQYTEKYLNYLKHACLVFTVETYAGSVEKRIRKGEKSYLVDPGLLQLAGTVETGKICETVISQSLFSGGAKIYWWHNKYEVDLVLAQQENIFPIEVKCRESIRPEDLKGVMKFLEVYQQSKGFLITKDILEEKTLSEKNIFCIPAWLFTLLY